MSVDGDFFRFSGGRLQPVSETHSEHLTVADSFLVMDGSVRALDLHLNRFRSSVTRIRPEISNMDTFFDSTRELIPRSGAWFPRLEFREDCAEGCLFLRIRPAPQLTSELTLWTHPEPDSRSNPAVKGPDLSLCQQLRRAANLHGADEAVILDEHGFIADGALSSIVWWREDTLFGPDVKTNWLPSVTRHLVFDLADQAGFQTREEHAKPSDLAGCEVWSLSALQGVRGVTEWVGVQIAKPQRHNSFRKRLSLISQPI